MATDFKRLEESCVPSYCHPNLLLAGAAWWRLFAAAKLARRYASQGPILDFGASVGELQYLLPVGADYHYVEADEALATGLQRAIPGARREGMDSLPRAKFSAVFALDSLEHNTNRQDIIETLHESLTAAGTFILSGPTENVLYRFGRAWAGFQGHYHETDVRTIEREVGQLFRKIKVVNGPFALPLFRVSVWRKER